MTITKTLIAAFEAQLAWQELPAEFVKTRNGWAGYKGGRRFTRFFFSESGAREAAAEWEASDVKVEFKAF